MKLLVVLTFDVPAPASAATVLRAIDPPRLPFFTGDARVTVDPYATAVENYLDDDEARA